MDSDKKIKAEDDPVEYQEIDLKDGDRWMVFVKNNTDAYSKCCVDVARAVMELIDEQYTNQSINASALIGDAESRVDSGGITGAMAGMVAQMVVQCHTRGEEFKKSWNGDHGVEEDVEGVVNPAIITINTDG